ncbi:sterol desaturase family protein [Chryseobacterium sp. MEBOG06]|uniref:sterol desaturase family protein n=1 Tax=Chryseobacterium sp. MEBOG06 TaxID=2879938 RepID=UPI001F25C47F|nr:sterol desaturase family protein [Chryseobacterium sp. MEBOG06]UKB85543.1 sterol desaturase family protein [Chryseobacterium sp. MEBOG06]
MFDFTSIFKSDGPDIVYTWTIPLFAVIIFIEMAYSHFNKEKIYETKDVATNVLFALLNYSLDIIMKGFSMFVMMFFYQHRLFTWEVGIWYWIAVFLAQDLAYYIHHYVDHHSRVFWAVHITHHNSEYFNISTGFRSPVFQPLYRYLFFSPLAFMGFHPLHVMVAYSAIQIYGTFVHTQSIKSMGFLEYILVTPSHHRVHHACNIKYLDRNMGMGLIIWDKIFGTFEKEDPEVPVKYGVYPKIKSKDPATMLFYEWRRIGKDLRQPGVSFKNRIKYLFYSPGWRHDGTGKTVKQYQKEYNEKIRNGVPVKRKEQVSEPEYQYSSLSQQAEDK